MQVAEIIRKKLAPLDGKDYGNYQRLKGTYNYKQFSLHIDQIPKDPFAPPHTGMYRIRLPLSTAGILDDWIDSRTKQIALRDWLSRKFYRAGLSISKENRGTGYSGIITIAEPGQAILERSSLVIDNDEIEVRFFMGLPARGRKIDAELAESMLIEELPEIVASSLYKKSINQEELLQHIHKAVNATYIRENLQSMGFIAFIADGAILPRKSGTSDEPLAAESAIPFSSPDNMRINIDLPHGPSISGMGIAPGVTLIVGGGYHGKSTLLQTLEQGIYNHIPGDGREQCVSLPGSVKIRAYSGRSVTGTDISPFIRNLPLQKDTTRFSTSNASGSTSQAAAISEAIEIGANVLLMDEDTSATNFMIRDQSMQQLVQKKDEPITAYIDKVSRLYKELNISTILVLGGVGDYFAVADRVIQMLNFLPEDVTQKAREIAANQISKRQWEDEKSPLAPSDRIPLSESINPYNKYGKPRLFAREMKTLNIGESIIDLTDLEQLKELSQTKAIGHALLKAKEAMDEERTLREIVDRVIAAIDEEGLDVISEKLSGHLAQIRVFELAFALNRLRELKIKE